MLEETAVVVDTRDGYLWVESQPRSSCSQCASSSCTTSVVAKLFGVKTNRLMLENTLDARTGQKVIIGIPDDLLVRASIWAYMMPLIVMLLLVALGQSAGLEQGAQSLLALSGLAAGFVLMFLKTRSPQAQKHYIPRLLEVCEDTGVRIEITNLSRS